MFWEWLGTKFYSEIYNSIAEYRDVWNCDWRGQTQIDYTIAWNIRTKLYDEVFHRGNSLYKTEREIKLGILKIKAI